MPAPQTIKLLKPWAGHPIGATFTVLSAGEELAPGKVDAARAATLLRQKFAGEPTVAEPTAKQPKPMKPAKKED